MIKNYFIFTVCALMFLVLSSCTKEVPPELLKNNNNSPGSTQNQEMPDDSIHRNLKNRSTQEGKTGDPESWNDEGLAKLTEEADAADAAYRKSKSEKDKETCIKMQLRAANYLMFEADLPPKDKYKPALQRYRRILELDPGNQEAMVNKEQIEEIYESMGKPIPN